MVGIEELWNVIGYYDGIDVAQNCIDITNKIIHDLAIEEKAKVTLLDAVDLHKLDKKYDLIIFTWFTAGNFYPFNFNFETHTPGRDMRVNDKFTMIFKQAYEMLNLGGEIVIGSMYIDNEATRKKQEKSYEKFGWDVITNEKDCFTATKKGWWSQRFTVQRVLDYLNFIPEENFSFIPLDTYDYAMMVRIRK